MRPRSANLPEVSLKDRALRLLSRREHSRAELRRKLAPHAEDVEQLEALLDDLVQQGFLSDVRFAESYVHSRGGRLGSRRIERELRDKGIPAEIAQQTLNASAIDDLATARVLRERKFGALPVDEKEKARQVRFLQGRGFSLTVALKVIKAPDGD